MTIHRLTITAGDKNNNFTYFRYQRGYIAPN